MMKERDPRVARSFTVRINEDVLAVKPRWDIVTAKNISVSGVLFNYDHYLEPGTRIQLKITLPFCGSVECEGDVVRNEMGTPRGFGKKEPAVCGVAVVFRHMGEQERQALREFCAQQQTDSESSKPVAPAPAGAVAQRAKRIARQYVTRIRRDGREDWELVAVQNISESGIFFTYSQPLDPDEELSLKMILPFSESAVFCRADIVRVEDKTRPNALVKVYGIAASFTDLDEKVRQGLREYADRMGQ